MDCTEACRNVQVSSDELQCHLCMCVLNDPVVLECRTRVEGGKCEAILCHKPCSKELISKQKRRGGVVAPVTGKCILCRAPWHRYRVQHLVTLGRITALVKRKCANFERGCDFEGTVEEVAKHRKDGGCPHDRLACPNRAHGCAEMVLRKDIGKHRAECACFPCRFFLNGDGCAHVSRLSDLALHESTCAFSSVQCRLLVNNARLRGIWASGNDNNCLRWERCESGAEYLTLPDPDSDDPSDGDDDTGEDDTDRDDTDGVESVTQGSMGLGRSFISIENVSLR